MLGSLVEVNLWSETRKPVGHTLWRRVHKC